MGPLGLSSLSVGLVKFSPSLPTAYMVVFAGQSQANSNGTMGNGTNTYDVPAVIQPAMTNVFTWDPYGQTWQTYTAGINSGLHLQGGPYPSLGQQFYGCEAEFVRQWKLDNPTTPLYIVKQAYSSTSLIQANRAPLRGCWDPTLTSDLYVELKNSVLAAKANLATSGYSVSMRGMCWTQGEGDTAVGMVVGTYATALISFINACRADFLGPGATFVISRIQTNTWVNPGPTRADQQTVGETELNCRWVDADGIPLAADATHYNPAGVVTHGLRMYRGMLSGPEITAKYISKYTTQPNAAYKTALQNLFTTLADKSVWPTISVLQLYANSDSQAATINAQNNLALTITASNSGMSFTAGQGFRGTSVTSFLSTGYAPSTVDPTNLTQNNASYSLYIRDNVGLSPSGQDMGNFTAAGFALLNAPKTGDTAGFRVHEDGVNVIIPPQSNVAGLWTMMRTASNLQTMYKSAVSLVSDTTASVAPTSGVMWVGNRNNSTTNGTLRQYAASVAGMSRTVSQETALSNALDTYVTAVALA
jgi:Carbohydrate esterase, sialic acid-specific acetylesterase